MPPHRCLRPIILPAAHQLPLIPRRLPCPPIIHQYYHRRTTATLRPPFKPQSYAFYAGSATAAAMLGAVLWLRSKRSTDAPNTVPSLVTAVVYVIMMDFSIMSTLNTAFQEYLGCSKVAILEGPGLPASTGPDDDVVMLVDLQLSLFLDADAASENIEPNVVGAHMVSEGREEIELISYLLPLLNNGDRRGLLRRQGKAVCLISSKSLVGIWIYAQEAMEVEDADLRYRAVDGGGWLCRILSVEK